MTIEQKFEMIKQLHKEIDEEISLLNNKESVTVDRPLSRSLSSCKNQLGLVLNHFISIEKQYLGHITHSKQI